MQIGFNNDVDWEGERFHIQTEDLGLSAGKITSQVFRGGAIVDTISVSYTEHVEGIEDPEKRDEEIRKRMRTLHKLCFRHIKANKYTPDGQAQDGNEANGDIGAEADEVEHTTETPAVERPNDEERTEIDGFNVAGEQEELGDQVDEKSRGEPVDLDEEAEEPQKAVKDEQEEEPEPHPKKRRNRKSAQEPPSIAAFRGLDFIEEKTLPDLLNELISQ